MRSRLSLAAPVLFVAALALAGCATTAAPAPAPDATSSPTADAGSEIDPATDLCGAAYKSGATIDAVTVVGDFDTEPTITLDTSLVISDIERGVVIEGDGEQLAYGDLVDIAQTIFDAETGEKVADMGWTQDITSQALVAETGMAQVIGCATVGSRIVATTPGSDQRPAYVWVFDVRGLAPTKAWGVDQPAVDGMPTVTLANDGTPSVQIPEGDAPTEVTLATLKEGDGDVVESGDTVTVQYMGIKWSDGTSFDSSWKSGAPAAFPTTGVVEGFKQALEGYKVGSQVLVVVPPAFGYGAKDGDALQKETLVFVVDILRTASMK